MQERLFRDRRGNGGPGRQDRTTLMKQEYQPHGEKDATYGAARTFFGATLLAKELHYSRCADQGGRADGRHVLRLRPEGNEDDVDAQKMRDFADKAAKCSRKRQRRADSKRRKPPPAKGSVYRTRRARRYHIVSHLCINVLQRKLCRMATRASSCNSMAKRRCRPRVAENDSAGAPPPPQSGRY